MSAGRTNNQEVKSVEWCTPPKYIAPILKFLTEIDLDPCSNKFSLVPAKVKFTLPDNNGLSESWDNYKHIFVNPPYGRDEVSKTSIYDWVDKCNQSNETSGSEILLMIPVSTNTSHFKDIIFKKAKGISFLNDTRLKFWQNGKEDPKGCPVAICLIYWGSDYEKFENIFKEYGKCFEIKIN